MSILDPSTDADLEECTDRLDEFVASLRYPEAVLAGALRIHLSGVLSALLTHEQCTRDEARAFVRELEQSALS